MRTNTWLALAAVTAVVAGGAIYAVTQREERVAVAAAGAPVLPGFAQRINDVAKITVTGTKGAFDLVRQDADRWVIPQKADFPAKADTMKKTVVGLGELATVEPRTANPELYERIGVGEPGKDKDAVGLALYDAKGARLAEIIIGKTKTYEFGGRPAEIYARVPGQKQSWLATSRLTVSADPLQWVDRDISRLGRDRMERIVISHASDEPPLRVIRDPANPKEFTLADIPDGQKLKSPGDTGSVAGGLDFLTFEDVKREGEIDFAKNPIVAVYSTQDGMDVTMRLVRHDNLWWAKFGVAVDAARAGDKAAEVQKEADALGARTGGWAFQLGEGNTRPFTRNASEMLAPVEEKKDDEGKAG